MQYPCQARKFCRIEHKERDKKKLKGDIYSVMVGCELQKCQGWLLEELVAPQTERSKDGNLVSTINFICCNMQYSFKKSE